MVIPRKYQVAMRHFEVETPVDTTATVKIPTKEVERFVEYANMTSSSTESDGEESEEGENERVVEKVVTRSCWPPEESRPEDVQAWAQWNHPCGQ